MGKVLHTLDLSKAIPVAPVGRKRKTAPAETVVEPVKKPRSEKQIAAAEKMRAARQAKKDAAVADASKMAVEQVDEQAAKQALVDAKKALAAEKRKRAKEAKILEAENAAAMEEAAAKKAAAAAKRAAAKEKKIYDEQMKAELIVQKPAVKTEKIVAAPKPEEKKTFKPASVDNGVRRQYNPFGKVQPIKQRIR